MTFLIDHLTQIRARTLIIWVGVLFFSLVLLSGRYDWSVGNRIFANVGYLSSAYMLVLFLPTFYYTLSLFLVHRLRLTIIITTVIGLWFTLPYRWLGLDKFYYSIEKILGPSPYALPDASGLPLSIQGPDWFPNALNHLPAIPSEGIIFGGLALMGLAITWFVSKKNPTSLRLTLLGLLAYELVLLQTWLHLSNRSPYLYITHFEQAPELNYWYVNYLFPNQMGGVNRDYYTFRSLEQIFFGIPWWSNILLSRSFFSYLTSQFSYFFNDYYVYLIFNVGMWFGAVICGYLFTRRLWSDRVALFTAALIACGPGFIMYVAQPMNYLSGFALIIILIYLYQRLVVENPSAYGYWILYTVILGFGALTYTISPFYLFLIGYGMLFGIKFWKSILMIILSLCIYYGFIFLHTQILKLTVDTTLSDMLQSAIRTIPTNLLSNNFGQTYTLTLDFITTYWGNLNHVFFIVPVIMAVIGLTFLHYRHQIITAWLLLLPSVAMQAILQFGQVSFKNLLFYYTEPRFLYIAYPAIYLLSAVFLDKIIEVTGSLGLQKWRLIPSFCIVFGLVILNNIDVWGFPVLYYLFYYPVGTPWLTMSR